MKDIKILSYSTCHLDQQNHPVLMHAGHNTEILEIPELESFLRPLLNGGWRLSHFSATDSNRITFVLEKD